MQMSHGNLERKVWHVTARRSRIVAGMHLADHPMASATLTSITESLRKNDGEHQREWDTRNTIILEHNDFTSPRTVRESTKEALRENNSSNTP